MAMIYITQEFRENLENNNYSLYDKYENLKEH